MKHAGFVFEHVPRTLGSALLIQAGEAVAFNQDWRPCRNDGCRNWFQIGKGKSTQRRRFCSDNCRVTHAHRQKAMEV
jgi:hypothetical protein